MRNERTNTTAMAEGLGNLQEPLSGETMEHLDMN